MPDLKRSQVEWWTRWPIPWKKTGTAGRRETWQSGWPLQVLLETVAAKAALGEFPTVCPEPLRLEAVLLKMRRTDWLEVEAQARCRRLVKEHSRGLWPACLDCWPARLAGNLLDTLQPELCPPRSSYLLRRRWVGEARTGPAAAGGLGEKEAPATWESCASRWGEVQAWVRRFPACGPRCRSPKWQSPIEPGRKLALFQRRQLRLRESRKISTGKSRVARTAGGLVRHLFAVLPRRSREPR
mmetsp:Transcript_12196/g.26869  ORF Transcript_12196/g.26869 Transcript_12196/m.26869 type:complete len:241 (-) Transcript_12196:45-767(-)